MVRSEGTFKGQEVYVPTYNDAVENKDYISTHVFSTSNSTDGGGEDSIPNHLSVILRKGSGYLHLREPQ